MSCVLTSLSYNLLICKIETKAYLQYGYQYSQSSLFTITTSLVAQLVKNPPAMQEVPVQSLGQKDPLEKKMATQSSILAWEVSWTEETVRLQSMRSQGIGHDLATKPLLPFIVCVCTCSVVSSSCNLWIIAGQAPLFMGFSPGRNTEAGCHFLLQGIFQTQGSS